VLRTFVLGIRFAFTHPSAGRRDVLYRFPCLLPAVESGFEVRDVRIPHVGERLRGERGTAATGAEDDDALVLVEVVAVVRTRRVGPELEHAARRVDGAGNGAEVDRFLNLADVDQQQI